MSIHTNNNIFLLNTLRFYPVNHFTSRFVVNENMLIINGKRIRMLLVITFFRGYFFPVIGRLCDKLSLVKSKHFIVVCVYYPFIAPPQGGRLTAINNAIDSAEISIHSLRKVGDSAPFHTPPPIL